MEMKRLFTDSRLRKLVLFGVVMMTALGLASATATWVPFVVSTTGKVGVGISEPVTPLHVALDNPNTGGVSGLISLTTLSNPTEGLQIGYNSADHFAWMQANEYGGSDPYKALDLQPESGNVGINTSTPGARLTVNNGDVYVNSSSRGLVLKAPDGHCSRIQLQNNDTLSVTPITCP